MQSLARNYITVNLNGRKFKALVDTGNSTSEAVAISENLFKQMKGKLERKLLEPTGTA